MDTGHRLNIICGHYGSGKTNIAVNLAIDTKKAHPDTNVIIADLDIVNPYFRTADAAGMLSSNGVIPAIPEFANTNVDIPSLPPQLVRMIENENAFSFIDVGGDDGAVALGMYRSVIEKAGYSMIFVINMYRPLISEPDGVLESLAEIEGVSGLRCTGIINNSSLGAETTAGDVLASVPYARRCAEKLSLPLLGHTYCPEFTGNIDAAIREKGYENEIFIPIKNATKKLF